MDRWFDWLVAGVIVLFGVLALFGGAVAVYRKAELEQCLLANCPKDPWVQKCEEFLLGRAADNGLH